MTEYICEVCEKPAADPIHDDQEGLVYCGPCAVSLLGGERDRYRDLLLLVAGTVPADWKNGTKRQREVYRGLTEVLADQRRMESSDAR